ncbi:MAG TPA: hypothetical protein PKK33_11420 [Candidatus Cloacimonadota bacterium]|nr:hypothetical protein [Candidatus Cloacimonadota bacterium]
MKRVYLVMVFAFVLIGQVLCIPTVFGETESPLAERYYDAVKLAAEYEGLFYWARNDIVPVIQITEQDHNSTDAVNEIILTVTFGFSKYYSKPEMLPFGAYCDYTPIKTLTVSLDADQPDQTIISNLYRLEYLVSEFESKFLDWYGPEPRQKP